MSNLFSPFVSVIIPVFNDSERLKTCLKALENQTYSQSYYEVVVVDNGSDESIEEVVGQFDQAIATYESHPGSYAARNKGILLAKGEVIAFTDADCIPASDWIEKGAANLRHVLNCGMVAGKIEFFFNDPDHPTALELYDSVTFLQQQQYLEKRKFGATANLFTFKEVFEKTGFFNSELKSGGDYEWGQRVFSSGYQQIYADDTCVAHPARYSFKELHDKIIRTVRGLDDLSQRKAYSFTTFLRDLARDLAPPFKIFFQIQSDRRFDGYQRKIKFIFALLFMKYVTAWERIQVLRQFTKVS